MTSTSAATSRSVTKRDRQNHALVLDLIKKSNQIVTSFAKQMVTTSLSAVGAILALAKFRGFEANSDTLPRIGLIASCGLCLIASLVFALALRARRIAVSLDDFSDAPDQLLKLARHRELLTIWGLALLACGIAGAILLLALL
jgi:hypothetical protein